MTRKSIQFDFESSKLSIEFETVDELKAELEKLGEVRKLIAGESNIGIAARLELRDELRDICNVQGNYVILNKLPDNKTDQAILAVYAYGPAGSTRDQIIKTTGNQLVFSNIIKSGHSREYFVELDKTHTGLNGKGIERVTRKIIPKLREG